jgi:hypothetical protein
MSFTYDPSTLQGQVRMLVADTDSTHPLFSDAEVESAINIESSQSLYVSSMLFSTGNVGPPPVQVSSPYLAAAVLLDALAANKSRLAAINELLDVHVSADKAAAELRATAKDYRDRESNMGHFAIAEMGDGQFWARERIWKQLLRLYAA